MPDCFKEDGHIYCRLYISCPVCIDQGRMPPKGYWQHHKCNGDIYVGDDACYKCRKCGEKSYVRNWKYSCPGHSNSSDNFVGASCQALASAISIAGQGVPLEGFAWLRLPGWGCPTWVNVSCASRFPICH